MRNDNALTTLLPSQRRLITCWQVIRGQLRFFLSSGIQCNTCLAILSSLILCTCPNHLIRLSWTDSSSFSWRVCSRILSLQPYPSTICLGSFFILCCAASWSKVGFQHRGEGLLSQWRCTAESCLVVPTFCHSKCCSVYLIPGLLW